MASKQAERGLLLNEHEIYGGGPAQHFSRALYKYLPKELREQVSSVEFYAAMEVLKKLRVAWVWKTLKPEDGFAHIHMWNLQQPELTAVYGWDGGRLERNEALTLMEDYSTVKATGSEPNRSFWIRKALEELTTK